MTIVKELSQGDLRTIKARKNIIASGLIKVADGITNLLIVPVTLGYLSTYEYGVWLVLSSILSWINTFDIGLGNGLRNKLSEALAKDDKDAARTYVTTTMVVLIGIVVALICVFTPVIYGIDWFSALNADEQIIPNLKNIIYIAFVLFCFNFLFKFIGNVYQALQLPAINNLIIFLGRFLSLILVFVCSKFVTGSLLVVSIIYSASPLIVYLIAYPITFSFLYSYLSPSIKFFDKHCIKDLLSLSILFFLLQLGGLVLFTMSNFMISKWFGPEEVTPYNIAYQYFSIAFVAFSLLITPLWSAVTDAYVQKEMAWIRRTHKTVKKMLVIMFGGLLLMLVASQYVYNIWIGDVVYISFKMSLFLASYVFITMYSLAYSYFLNGMNKLKIQTINTIGVALLFIPICFFFSRLWGTEGIIVGMCILNLPGAILNKIQFNKVIKGKDTGLWSE